VNGRIVQISVSPGGVPKKAVAAARVTTLGLEGDQQRDMEHHGGPERAVCLYAMEAIDKLRAEGHAIVPGAIGENITAQGLEWAAVIPGSYLRLGESVILQVTRFTSPCTNIMPVFKGGDFSRVSEKRHPGWSRVYARVLATGAIRQGDPVRLLSAAEVAEVTAAPSR
jgi:MOSC domain-containing protein YiiM